MIQTLKSQYFLNRYNFLFYKTLIWLGMIIGLSNHSVLAQNVVTIKQSNMPQPIILTGNTGGNTKAFEVSQTKSTTTGYCDGYVNSQPNHLLQIESFFESLRLEVNSSADTIILVKGNNGVWCNDDAGSANPIIEGQWQEGLYKVWVGSYQADSSNSYQIQITGREQGKR